MATHIVLHATAYRVTTPEGGVTVYVDATGRIVDTQPRLQHWRGHSWGTCVRGLRWTWGAWVWIQAMGETL